MGGKQISGFFHLESAHVFIVEVYFVKSKKAPSWLWAFAEYHDPEASGEKLHQRGLVRGI